MPKAIVGRNINNTTVMKYLKLFCAAASIAAVSASALAEKVVLAGSDLLGAYIADTAGELAKKDGVELECKMLGSFSALEELDKGEADFAVIGIPKGRPLPEGYELQPFAYQIAVVVVNSANPIEEISKQQLIDIFSSDTKKRAETWSQLNVNNFGLSNIMPLVTSFSDNVVIELFKYSALNSTNIGSWVTVAKDKQAIFNMIKANNAAIGVVGKLTDTNMLKALPIYELNEAGGKSYSFGPSRENVYNGDYPLVLPFYIAYKKSAAPKIKAAAKILFSDAIASKIDSSDFISAPESSRKKSIFELDMAN